MAATRQGESGVANDRRSLVIDDDRLVRMNTRLVLEREGWLVDEAAGIAEAMALLQAQTYDLMICDITLPDGNGLDLLNHTHRLLPEMAVVLMTGSATGLSLEAALDAGAVALLEKPFPLGALVDEVRARSASRRPVPPARPPRSEPQA